MPKMQILVKQQYSWRLEQLPAFRLIGKSIRCTNGEQHLRIPEFWSECQSSVTFSELISIDTGNPKGLFGLYRNWKSNTGEIEYSVMVAADGSLPDGYSEARIQEAIWAVFDCRGAVPPGDPKWVEIPAGGMAGEIPL